jgi:hypothetical protein
MTTSPETAVQPVLLAHIYVQSKPVAYVIGLVLTGPVALVTWWFWVRMMVPRWRERTPPVSKDQPNAVGVACGCHLMAFLLLVLVGGSIWGLIERL